MRIRNPSAEGAEIISASQAAAVIIMNADPSSDDGRSQWLWVRLSNGDLIFGCYPQGDTYFAAFEETGDDRRIGG